MKKITCEVCFSNQFIRDEEFFTCEHCGTKYTLAVIQKMFVEGVVKIDSSEDLNNLEILLERSYEERKMRDLLNYANDLLRKDPNHFNARLYKIIATAYTNGPVEDKITRYANELWKFYDEAQPAQQNELVDLYVFEFQHSVLDLAADSIDYYQVKYGLSNNTQQDYYREMLYVTNGAFYMKKGFEDRDLITYENEIEIDSAYEKVITQTVIQVTNLWVETFNKYYNDVFSDRTETSRFYNMTAFYVQGQYTSVQTEIAKETIRDAYLTIYNALKHYSYKSEVAGISLHYKVTDNFSKKQNHALIFQDDAAEKQKKFDEKYKNEKEQLATIYAEIDEVKAQIERIGLLQFKEKKNLEARLSSLRRQTEEIKNLMK